MTQAPHYPVTITQPAPPARAEARDQVEQQARREDWRDSKADNTIGAYRTQFGLWAAWAAERGTPAMPAEPLAVRAYLIERAEDGRSVSTLRSGLSAISAVHRAEGLESPCDSQTVKLAMAALARQYARPVRQATGLTDELLERLRADAAEQTSIHLMLKDRGTIPAAERRQMGRRAAQARQDVAIAGLLRDGLLRRSELAEARWADLELAEDGSGRLTIRRSKTDQLGAGHVAYISPQTISDLLGSYARGAAEDTILGIRDGQIGRRLRAAGKRIEVEGLSGDSGRVGMARDLVRHGATLPEVMQSGRWDTPAMVSHYRRAETAGHSAVARFHADRARNSS